ncbi:MAG TPA: bifunctional alpha,alpha-trehalose-phosphate synthase (UDP-forming)/trehalose-phosphatase [Candidatus Saccharimonadales bacterium]|nr:bifunctional alpha,alpha-trehalose-phosphate synthase (UDP-forming)/trehalose-phosphatase [Candidatus Saccharimonadales bacterium]
MQQGVIIVSNRLPVSVKRNEAGELEFYNSVGGLATGLSSYVTNKKNKWIGWPGIASDDLSEQDKSFVAHELLKRNCYPVFLTKKQLDDYYNGYSNSILWPMLHDMTPHLEQHDRWWKAYRAVNKVFADVVLTLSEPGGTIWVHDYHLFKLPSLLRAERPSDKIGFFLHIPFPSVDGLQMLPSAKSLLNGMLGSDLVGFHTPSYVQNFLGACQHFEIGLVSEKQVILEDRVVRVTEFPISIDYAKFARATRQRAVRRAVRRLQREYRGKRIVLTVDRLDPTKGLVERLKAYEQFLRVKPELQGKVVMVMLAVPSRTDIEDYKQLKTQLERRVRKINKEFGTVTWRPVEYMYTILPFEELAALYQVADVAFIAPLRDGMNLVAKEYVASRPKHNGVLILSATAGAAEELTEALIVDPSQPHTVVDALVQAFTLPERELRHRIRSMQKHLQVHTIHAWAGTFIKTLQQPMSTPRRWTKGFTTMRKRELLRGYRHATHRLLLLDYDGVLVPYTPHYTAAEPPDSLRELLTKLSAQPDNEVVVISGRSKRDIDSWLGDLPISLVAEHGAFIREAGHRWKQSSKARSGWQKDIVPIMEEYTAKTPGALVEKKEQSVVWHYRDAAPYYAHKHLVILKRLLRPIARRAGLEVRHGNKILEVRPTNVDKGKAAGYWLRDNLDFILAVGDDYTDEDTFAALPPSAFTIKVGRGRTLAKLRLKTTKDVIRLLKDLNH